MADTTVPGAIEQASRPPSEADAQAAVARFRGFSGEIRGVAILDPIGEVLAASGELERWGQSAGALLDAADAAAGGVASHAHVATEEGEVYAVRWDGLAMVAVSDRFTLASLVLSDMRSVLRSLPAPPAVVAG